MDQRRLIFKRVDEKAILTMIVVAVISLVVMAWQFVNYTPCPSFKVESKANRYITGEAIRFESDIKSFKSLRWNFGDNQGNDTKISSAVHAYNEPGEYVVSLTANGECTEYTIISVSPAPRVENPKLTVTFVCPQSAEVGRPVQFSDTTAGATQWEWRFGETATVDATEKAPKYTYTAPGLKTVSVVINNDQQQIGICKVYVNPAPVKAPPKKKEAPIIILPAKPANPADQGANAKTEPVKKAPEISGPEMEAMLREVANKTKTADSFSEYLCGNQNIQVSLNQQTITFAELCNKFSALKNDKKIKKLTVQLVKNDKTGCVVAMIVNMEEKKGFFRKIF